MTTMTIREENKPDYSLCHMMEAFTDILKATKSDVFDEIALETNDDQLYLRYKVNLTGVYITKLFNMDQGEPELKSDVMEYLFSMLDGAVNLM